MHTILSYREDNMPNNENNEAVNPISENQAELENGISEDNTAARGVEATPPPPPSGLKMMT